VPNRVRGSEKGKRLIIIHAMTKDDMLEKLTKKDGEPSDNLNDRTTQAELCPSTLSATSELRRAVEERTRE
jgi:hypothetical protein